MECLDVIQQTGFREHLLWAVTGSGKTEMILDEHRMDVYHKRENESPLLHLRIDVCGVGARLKEASPTVEQKRPSFTVRRRLQASATDDCDDAPDAKVSTAHLIWS